MDVVDEVLLRVASRSFSLADSSRAARFAIHCASDTPFPNLRLTGWLLYAPHHLGLNLTHRRWSDPPEGWCRAARRRKVSCETVKGCHKMSWTKFNPSERGNSESNSGSKHVSVSRGVCWKCCVETLGRRREHCRPRRRTCQGVGGKHRRRRQVARNIAPGIEGGDEGCLGPPDLLPTLSEQINPREKQGNHSLEFLCLLWCWLVPFCFFSYAAAEESCWMGLPPSRTKPHPHLEMQIPWTRSCARTGTWIDLCRHHYHHHHHH